MSNIGSRLLFLLVGFVAGGATVGIIAMKWVIKPEQDLFCEFLRNDRERQFLVSYLFADYDATECAFEQYRQIAAKAVDDGWRGPAGRELLLSSLGLAFARLAGAAEKAGKLDASEKFLGTAGATFAAIGNRPTVEQIKQLRAKADQNWQEELGLCRTTPRTTPPSD